VLKVNGTAGKSACDSSNHHDFAVLSVHAERLHRVVIFGFGQGVPLLNRSDTCERATLIPDDGVSREAPSHGAGVTN